jgi:hypothetical protein
MQTRFLSSCNRVKTFDFSSLYTPIPYSKLKGWLKEFEKNFCETDIINMLELPERQVGIPTVLLFLSTCFFIRIKQTSYKDE